MGVAHKTRHNLCIAWVQKICLVCNKEAMLLSSHRGRREASHHQRGRSSPRLRRLKTNAPRSTARPPIIVYCFGVQKKLKPEDFNKTEDEIPANLIETEEKVSPQEQSFALRLSCSNVASAFVNVAHFGRYHHRTVFPPKTNEHLFYNCDHLSLIRCTFIVAYSSNLCRKTTQSSVKELTKNDASLVPKDGTHFG